MKKENFWIKFSCYFFLILFLGTFFYIGVYAKNHYRELISNSYNGYQKTLLLKNQRGTIYSGDGQIIAQSSVDENGKETRVYPYGSLFSHVVGYSTHGRTGLEQDYHYELIHSSLSVPEKIEIEKKHQKIPADSLMTTLDTQLQEIAAKSLGVYQGAVIVSEVSTGRILAMVSKPDYDPNEIGDIWESLQKDEESSILLNRVTQGLYPPGSIFKILTTLDYIREFPDEWKDYHYSCTGSFSYHGDKINCYHGISHGALDFKSSFAKSCNSSFANIGMRLDREKLQKELENCYFNQDLPVDFVSKKSHCEISSGISDYDMLQSSIGQGRTEITPLHMNIITSAIANGGKVMKPYMVDEIRDIHGNLVQNFRPQEIETLMSEEETQVLKELMADVIQSGTGKRLQTALYTAAGKTGSAEYGNIKGNSHAWFTGFAPADQPEIAVTIIIEGVGSGGEYSVPIAKRIFDAYFSK